MEALGGTYGEKERLCIGNEGEGQLGENLSSYYEVYYKTDDIKAMQYWRDAKKDLIQMKASVQYIYSFHVIPEEGIYLTSESGSLGDNAWQEFMESEEGRYFLENSNQNTAWLGYHSYLDKQLSISQDKYAVAFYRKFSRGNTYLVLDIRTETVEEMLNQMDFGENSIKSLITQDGREITRIQNGDKSVAMENAETVFTDKDFYTASKGAEEAGSQYVNYNGEKYLYVYAPMGKTGMMLCGLIPQDNIVKEVRFIRNLSIIMIILASAIALLIGSRIAMGMGSAVKIMTNGMDKVAEGDLTQEFYINRKDEFSILARGMNGMLSSMRILMTDMKKFGNKVKEMADGVAAKSKIINTSIREISEAVDEVASGAQKQAHEADISNDMMIGFAEKVDGVCAGAGENGKGFAVVAEEIRKLADESMQAGKNIKKIVENILETTRKTTESAREAEAIVFEQADALEETIRVFGKINQCVETLVSGLRDITDNMRLINGEKEQVQDSMSHISVVTEQAAVATGEITSTLDEQVKTVADLAKNVELLKQEADALDQSIGRFIV